jgi:hypothetical protein
MPVLVRERCALASIECGKVPGVTGVAALQNRPLPRVPIRRPNVHKMSNENGRGADGFASNVY